MPRRLDRIAGRAIFGSGAQAYHDARAGYPLALFEHLRERAGVHPRVLEIGPGSGLATQDLLGLEPSQFVAVESDPDFAAFLARRFAVERVEIVTAPFPCDGLERDFDLAACASAFHWLEPAPTLAAIRELLRPGGIWAMWWNVYLDERAGGRFAADAMRILRERGVALPPSFQREGHVALDVEGQTAMLRAAGFTEVVHRQWQSMQERGTAEVRKLFQSFSFVRHLPEAERADLLDRIAHLVEARFGGVAPWIVVTSCYTARNPSSMP